MCQDVRRPEPKRNPATNKLCGASLDVLLGNQEVLRFSSRAAMIPEPINKTPAAAESKDPTGAPPVLGNAVALAPESSVVPAVAVGVALAVGVGLAVGVEVAVGLTTTSSAVGSSSKSCAAHRDRRPP